MGPCHGVRVPADGRPGSGRRQRLVAGCCVCGRPVVLVSVARRVRRVMAVRLYWHDGVGLADGGSRGGSACLPDGVACRARGMIHFRRCCLPNVSLQGRMSCRQRLPALGARGDRRASHPSDIRHSAPPLGIRPGLIQLVSLGAHPTVTPGCASVWLPSGTQRPRGLLLHPSPISATHGSEGVGSTERLKTTASGWMDPYEQKLHRAGDGRHADPELHAG